MLARYDISCDKEEAGTIRLGQLRGQQPATRAEYKEAVEACSSMDYIEYNVSQIARRFGLDGTRKHRSGAGGYESEAGFRALEKQGSHTLLYTPSVFRVAAHDRLPERSRQSRVYRSEPPPKKNRLDGGFGQDPLRQSGFGGTAV